MSSLYSIIFFVCLGSSSIIITCAAAADETWTSLYESIFQEDGSNLMSGVGVEETLNKLGKLTSKDKNIPADQSAKVREFLELKSVNDPSKCSAEFDQILDEKLKRNAGIANLKVYVDTIRAKLVEYCTSIMRTSFEYSLHQWAGGRRIAKLSQGFKLGQHVDNDDLADRLYQVMEANREYLQNIYDRRYMNSVNLYKNVMTFKRHYDRVCPCSILSHQMTTTTRNNFLFLKRPQIYRLLNSNLQELVDKIEICEILDRSVDVHQTVLNRIVESLQ